MRLPTHNFRSHISRSSTCIIGIVRFPNSCDSQVSYSYIAFLIKYQILWFYVSVNYVLIVKILQAQKYACNKEFCLLLTKSSLSSNMETQITSWHQIHNKVKIISILECVLHIYKKRVLQLC